MLKLSDEQILEDIDFLQYEDDFIAAREDLLRHAAMSFNDKLLKALLEAGANPNTLESGDSLLHDLVHIYTTNRSLKGGSILRIVELLLKAGADPNIKGCNNLTPLQRCRSTRAEEYEALLLNYGADPDKEEEPI